MCSLISLTRDSTFLISLIPGDFSNLLEASTQSGLSLEKISGIISADIPPAKIQGVLNFLLIIWGTKDNLS